MVLAYSEWGVWSSLSNFRIYLSPQKVPFISHSLFLLLSPSAMKSESESRLVMFDSLWPHGLYSLWNSPGQTTGAGSCSLLQGIFPTQGLNPGLMHCRQILYQLSHQGSPKIHEWVAYPFSRGSSLSRNWTGVSCIAGRFFTGWAASLSNHLSIYFLFLWCCCC